MIKRAIDCGEALIAVIIAKILVPETFICCLWLNTIMISLFTLIMPFVNDYIYVKFGLADSRDGV